MRAKEQGQMTEHTPGPWGGADGQIYQKNGNGKTLAVVYEDDNRDADTQLMAAAPQMLQVLEAIVEKWTESTDAQRAIAEEAIGLRQIIREVFQAIYNAGGKP
jgi:hypothetical protein